MKKIVPGALFLLIVLLACHQQKNGQTPQAAATDTARFYPIRAFLESQLAYAKAVNAPVYMIHTYNGKKDSVSLNTKQFQSLAGLFLERDISAPAIKVLYKEAVFHDQDTKSYTLTYSPTDDNTPVRGIDILLDEETNNVKRIFIRSRITRGDTSIIEQYNWKAFRSFQINRSLQAGKYSATELTYVNWNNDTP